MARITVEDCLDQVSNRFELVLLAAKRARQLVRGGQSFVQWGDDKATVVALREIADGHVNKQYIEAEAVPKPVNDGLSDVAESLIATAAEPTLVPAPEPHPLLSTAQEPTLGVPLSHHTQPTLGVSMPEDMQPTLGVAIAARNKDDESDG